MGREIRDARLAGGISLRTAAAAVGMSHAQLGRIERAELPNVSVDQLSLAPVPPSGGGSPGAPTQTAIRCAIGPSSR